jgi:hypothetical protein
MGMAQASAEGRISKAQWRAWRLPWRRPKMLVLAGRELSRGSTKQVITSWQAS